MVEHPHPLREERRRRWPSVGPNTHILDDLKVNSARLVDVVLAFEDKFGIEIADDDVDTVNTVGDAVRLISAKLGLSGGALAPSRLRGAIALAARGCSARSGGCSSPSGFRRPSALMRFGLRLADRRRGRARGASTARSRRSGDGAAARVREPSHDGRFGADRLGARARPCGFSPLSRRCPGTCRSGGTSPRSLASRVLVYLMKCVPVSRGGDRGEVAGVLGRSR